MKKILLITFIISWLSFNIESQNETNVRLKINHLLNGEKMELFKTIKIPNSYYINVELLRYYVSELKIIHDGGLISEVKDTWLLVNPASNFEYDLGVHNLTNIEGLQFSLGVDAEHNHLDPTVYPANHPLAMQDPSMHWGWASGYRFITFEGLAGTSTTKTNNMFQIHTLDDKNYRTVKYNLGSTSDSKGKIISLDAEYTKLLNGINASSGLIEHSAINEAAAQMKNLSTVVFSPSIISDNKEIESNLIEISPNPVENNIKIITKQYNDIQTVIISDMAGKQLMTVQKKSSILDIPISLSNGHYILSIFEKNNLVASKKLLILK